MRPLCYYTQPTFGSADGLTCTSISCTSMYESLRIVSLKLCPHPTYPAFSDQQTNFFHVSRYIFSLISLACVEIICFGFVLSFILVYRQSQTKLSN